MRAHSFSLTSGYFINVCIVLQISCCQSSERFERYDVNKCFRLVLFSCNHRLSKELMDWKLHDIRDSRSVISNTLWGHQIHCPFRSLRMHYTMRTLKLKYFKPKQKWYAYPCIDFSSFSGGEQLGSLKGHITDVASATLAVLLAFPVHSFDCLCQYVYWTLFHYLICALSDRNVKKR